MASKGQRRGVPDIGPLYVKMTTPRTDGAAQLKGARDIFGELSTSSQFKVALHLSTSQGEDSNLLGWLNRAGLTRSMEQNTYYDFFCHGVTIPGPQLNYEEEKGSRQGVIERMPTHRIYSPVQMDFYVDNDYKLIRLFEEWINYINPIYGESGEFQSSINGFGNAKDRNNFFRIRYPDDYKRIISIVKFERNFKESPASSGGSLGNVPTITYRLIDAYPVSIAGIPVSYEGSTITKTSVTFDYSRVVYEKNQGTL